MFSSVIKMQIPWRQSIIRCFHRSTSKPFKENKGFVAVYKSCGEEIGDYRETIKKLFDERNVHIVEPLNSEYQGIVVYSLGYSRWFKNFVNTESTYDLRISIGGRQTIRRNNLSKLLACYIGEFKQTRYLTGEELGLPDCGKEILYHYYTCINTISIRSIEHDSPSIVNLTIQSEKNLDISALLHDIERRICISLPSSILTLEKCTRSKHCGISLDSPLLMDCDELRGLNEQTSLKQPWFVINDFTLLCHHSILFFKTINAYKAYTHFNQIDCDNSSTAYFEKWENEGIDAMIPLQPVEDMLLCVVVSGGHEIRETLSDGTKRFVKKPITFCGLVKTKLDPFTKKLVAESVVHCHSTPARLIPLEPVKTKAYFHKARIHTN